MDLTIGPHKVRLLGDPHLGKRFIERVPLNRRGEREQLLWNDFDDSLRNLDGFDFHICMGDLFNSWFVPYDLILNVATNYYFASQVYPDTVFVILAGNHDMSKDLTKKSAFDIVNQILYREENIWMLSHPVKLDSLIFLPWSPTSSAEELVHSIPSDLYDAAFGHWDTDPRTSNGNLIPTKALAELGVTAAYTGHVHQKASFVRDGVTVVQVGSMQPYAHGEGDMYVTLSKEGVEDRIHNYGADWFKNKCVRVDLDPTEVWDIDLDCLQLQVRRDKLDEVTVD